MSEKNTKLVTKCETEIELSKLVKSPYNVRVEASVIGELAKNIQKNGLDNAILVRPLDEGKYEIVSGSRRFEAYKSLGRKTIPSISRELSDDEAMIHSLSENIARLDISTEEKARAVAILLGRKELLNEKDHKLISEKPMTEQELADRLGITRQSVNNMIEPLRQAKETRELVRSNRIGEDTARQIRQFVGENQKHEVALAKAVANAELTQTEVRNLLQDARQKKLDVEDIIGKLKAKDAIDDEKISSKLDDVEKELTDTSEKKPSLVSTSVDRDDVDLDDKNVLGETLNVTIEGKGIIKALNKYAEDEGTTVDEAVNTIVKGYLKKKGYY